MWSHARVRQPTRCWGVDWTRQPFSVADGHRVEACFFPTMLGFLNQVLSLGATIAVFSAVASRVMIAMLFLLPETRGRGLASLEAAPSTLAPLTEGGAIRGRGRGVRARSSRGGRASRSCPGSLAPR